MKTARWVMGLAVETGLDGIEAALVEIHGRRLDPRLHIRHSLLTPFSKDARELLVRVSSGVGGDVKQASLVNRMLGEMFAAAALMMIGRARVKSQRIVCAGCLGLVAWQDADRLASMLTLGSAAIVAERTGLTVIDDFHSRDLAAGGQGGPLHPLADLVLFADPVRPRLAIHLGGLSEVAYLPAGGHPEAAAGWVAGPGNALLDAIVRQYTNGKETADPGGKLAVQGRQIPELLARWLNHPYHLKRPPKAAHRNLFAEEFARQTQQLARTSQWSYADVLCTANHFVARTIGEGIRRWLPRDAAPAEAVLTGRGSRNGLLLRLLEEQLPGVALVHSESLDVPADARNAVHAALFASWALDHMPANLRSATGAVGSRLLGHFTPGAPRNWARCLALMTGQPADWADEDD